MLVGDSLLTDGKLAENLNIHFYHKTDLCDLGILLKKLKLSVCIVNSHADTHAHAQIP